MLYYPPCPKNKNRCLGSLVENTVFKARRQRSMSKNKLSLSFFHHVCSASAPKAACPTACLNLLRASQNHLKSYLLFFSHSTSHHPPYPETTNHNPPCNPTKTLLLYAPTPLYLHPYTFQLSISHHNQNPPTLLLRSSCEIRVRSPPWSMRNRKSLKSAHVWPLFLSSKSIMSSMHAAEPRLKDSVGHKTRKLLNAPYPACFSHLNFMTSGRSKKPRWKYTHPQQTLAQILICRKKRDICYTPC